MEPEDYHEYLDGVYNKHLDDNDSNSLHKKMQKNQLSEIMKSEL